MLQPLRTRCSGPFFFVLFTGLLVVPVAPLLAQSTYELTPSTSIPVRLLNPVASETDTSVRVISQVQAVVDRDVAAPDGKVLVAANTPVTMQASRQRSRGLGRPGEVILIPVSTLSTDGQLVALAGEHAVRGKSYKARVWGTSLGIFAAAVVTGSLLLASGQKEEVTQSRDDGKDARLIGGILLGLSPLSFGYLMRPGQRVTIPAGTVLPDVRPAQRQQIQ